MSEVKKYIPPHKRGNISQSVSMPNITLKQTQQPQQPHQTSTQSKQVSHQPHQTPTQPKQVSQHTRSQSVNQHPTRNNQKPRCRVVRRSERLVCFKEHGRDVKILLGQRRQTFQRSSIIAGACWYENHNDSQDFVNKMTRREQLELVNVKFDFPAEYRHCYRHKLESIAKNDPQEAEDLVSSAHEEFKHSMERLAPYFEHSIKNNINGALPWFFPGGGFKPNEDRQSYKSCLAVAKRETEEETKMNSSQYHILDELNPHSFKYDDDGATYHTECFFALAHANANPFIDQNDQDQLDEVSEVRWMNEQELSNLKLDTITRRYVLGYFREFIDRFNNWKRKSFRLRNIVDFY